ncbi:MAG: hypothetical protein VXZ72_02565 [Chlamydiota bacterium]|nr:hypothetical protein [Chlamydiota bacterium]
MAPPHTASMRKRKLAIVLLDIIGSTSFVAKVGDVRASKWFYYHDQLTRNLVLKHNGREIDRSDGFLLSFDTVLDAVNFGLTYQQTIPLKTRLDARIGVHWGELVEVTQDELWVGVGAKRVELEGISKNIAARTMSVCGPKQVLLTKSAYEQVKGRSNMFTPGRVMYACVGMYKFKGLREAIVLYAVGTDISRVQPPPSSEKATRLGGPKYIRLRARDRQIKDWLIWIYNKLVIICVPIAFYVFVILTKNRTCRELLGLQWFSWVEDVYNFVLRLLNVLWRAYG